MAEERGIAPSSGNEKKKTSWKSLIAVGAIIGTPAGITLAYLFFNIG